MSLDIAPLVWCKNDICCIYCSNGENTSVKKSASQKDATPNPLNAFHDNILPVKYIQSVKHLNTHANTHTHTQKWIYNFRSADNNAKRINFYSKLLRIHTVALAFFSGSYHFFVDFVIISLFFHLTGEKRKRKNWFDFLTMAFADIEALKICIEYFINSIKGNKWREQK